MAERTWAWSGELRARGLAVEMLAPVGFRSPTVSCLRVPPGKAGTAIDKEMKQRGYTISPGYGALKDSTIRIGHMGDHTVAELNELLQVLEEVLAAA
jgi:aspartate aminotransferase-like enzyme